MSFLLLSLGADSVPDCDRTEEGFVWCSEGEKIFLKSFIFAIFRKVLTDSSENAWSCSWHHEKKPHMCRVTICVPDGSGIEVYLTTEDLLPCTVADAGLLEKEIIILAVAMIS